MFDTVDGEWMFIVIAEALNGIRARRKGFAADYEVVRDVYDDAVQVTSRGCGRQKSRDKRQYEQTEGIPFHGLLLMVWSGSSQHHTRQFEACRGQGARQKSWESRG